MNRVLVENDTACGVVLDSGERIAARTVISNADPKTTLLNLLGAEHLDTGFVRKVSHLRTNGLAAKLHLALDAVPRFGDQDAAALGGRLLVAPSLDYIERAFNHSKYGEYSDAPAIEITVPTVRDPALAPAGGHVISAVVQYAPYALRAGWETERERMADRVIDVLELYAPGLRSQVRARELLTPARHRAAVPESTGGTGTMRNSRSTSSSCCVRSRAPRSTARRCRGSTCVAQGRTRAAA